MTAYSFSHKTNQVFQISYNFLKELSTVPSFDSSKHLSGLFSHLLTVLGITAIDHSEERTPSLIFASVFKIASWITWYRSIFHFINKIQEPEYRAK